MEAISILGTLLGLSFISGINLYATIAAVGICIKSNLVSNYPPELSVLANNFVIASALVFYGLEFVTDKIPGLDTLWDLLHTFIRPLGGAFLAFLSLANGSPVAEVFAFMLGSFIAGLAHLTKAGTRLVVQLSPEPVSNVIASLGEDVFTVGYGYFVLKFPAVAFFCTIILIALILFIMPKILRLTTIIASLVFYKLTGRYRKLADFSSVPQFWDEHWKKVRDLDEKSLWSGPAFVKNVSGMPRFKKGWLIVSENGVYFYTKKFGRVKYAFRRGVPWKWRWQSGKMVDICYLSFDSGEEWSFYMLGSSEEFFRARLFSREMKVS